MEEWENRFIGPFLGIAHYSTIPLFQLYKLAKGSAHGEKDSRCG
jgi:hypothetical protein